VCTPQAKYDGTRHCATLRETKQRLVSANTCPACGDKGSVRQKLVKPESVDATM
jgi:hypothetical protein